VQRPQQLVLGHGLSPGQGARQASSINSAGIDVFTSVM
jgi:hypothetical protein